MEPGGGGFDAGAFAAKMSSIGHAGNGGAGGGGVSLSLGGEVGGSLSPTLPGFAAGDVTDTISKGQGSGFLEMGFKLLFSLSDCFKYVGGIFDAGLGSIGTLLAPIASPLSTLPNPSQSIVSGGKK